MINTGFNDVKKDVGQLKTDIDQLRQETQAGFERTENLLWPEQPREIEDLKKRLKRLDGAVAL